MRNMGGLLRGICLGWGLTVTTWTGAEATEHFVFGLTANQSCDVYQGSTLIQQGVPSSSEGGLTFSATGSGTFQVVSTGTFVDTTPPGTIGNLATGTATSSSIQLSWTSTGDDGGTGQAQVYDLRYATSPITDANWASATQATGEPLPKPTGQNETFTVTGLTAATTYYFAVKAGDEVPNFGPLSNVASGATSGGGDTTPPTAVSNLATGSPSASSISLSWTATGDDGASGKATTYDLRYATSPINAGNFASATQVSGEPAPKTSGSSETFTVTGLAAGTTYYFALKVADEVPNWSGISNVPSGTTTNPDVTAPAAVTNLATGTLTATSIQLNWTAVGDDGTSGKATTYDLRYSTSTITTANWGTATQVTGEPAPKTSGSAETFTVTGLASNTKYYFALKVADEVPNVSGLSNVPSATTLIPPDQTAPSAVTNLAVASSSSSSISLTWTATGDDGHTGTASVYDLRYSNQPITTTSSWNAATQATNEPTPKANGQSEAFTVPGLNSGTTYYFALKVGDEVPNWSGLSNSPSGLTPAGGDLTPPSNITDLAVAGTSSSSVTLRWTAVGDDGMSGNCTRYDMRYGDVPILTNDDYSDANYAPNEPVPVTPGQQQTMTISGLAPGHTYYFAVRAADEVFNWSQISNSPGGTTQGGADVTAPTAVTTLAVTTSTQNTMTVTWSAVGDDGLVGRATTYDLRYSTSSITSGNWANATKATGEPTPGLPGTAESFVLSGLSPNQTYYLALKVGDEVPNWSGLSNLPSGTTESGGDVVPPAQINNLAVSERQFDRLRVNWTATGDDGNEGVSDHFELRRSLSPITGSNWGSATPVAGLPAPGPQGTQHSVWSFGLNPNTRYYYAIKAFDEAGNASAISNVPSGITLDEPDGDPPIKVNDLEAMVIHTDAVELRWTAPHDTLHVTQRVHTYELRVHTAPVTEGGSGYRLVTGPNPSAPGQAEQFTLSGLLPNSQYYLRVRSCDEAGNWSRLSNQLMMTTEDGPPPDADETAPAAVADLDATSAGPDYVDLSWLATGDDGAVGTATSYDLRHATFPITTVTWDLATAVPGEPTPRIAGSHETMRVDGLSVGVMHYFALRVSDEAGNTSLLSNVVQQATPRPDDIAPPFSVFDLAVVDSTETSLSLHWTTPADSITPWAEGSGEIAEYQVRRSETPIDESNWVDATLLSPPEPGPAGTPASYAATGLEPGRVYYFALKSIDPSGNESALSNLAVGATKVIPPPPPDTMSPGSVQDLLFEPLDPQRAVLRWVATGDDGNEGRATEYRLRRIVGDEGITLDDEDLVWQFGDSIPIDLEPKAAGETEEFAQTDLQPGRSYAYGVLAIDDAGNLGGIVWSSPVTQPFPPDTLAPEAVDDLSATLEIVAGDTLILARSGATAAENDAPTARPVAVLRWLAPADPRPDQEPEVVAGYRMRWAEVGLEEIDWDSPAGDTLFTSPSLIGAPESLRVEGLAWETDYRFLLVSYDEAGNESPLSNLAALSVPADTTDDIDPPQPDTVPPAQIEAFEAFALGASSVQLAWLATGDDGAEGTASRYQMRWSLTAITVETWATADTVAGLSAPKAPGETESFVWTGRAPATTYHLALRALDEDGNGSPLASVTVATTGEEDSSPPAVPQQVAALWAADHVQVSWSPSPEPDLAEYHVFRRRQDEVAPVLLIQTVSPAHSDGSVAAGLTYYYSICARDVAGNLSARSEEVEVLVPVVPIGTPGAPDVTLNDMAFEPIDWRGDRLTLRWDTEAGDDLVGFRVLRQAEHEDAPRVVSPGLLYGDGEQVFIESPLPPAGRYQYWVEALGVEGGSLLFDPLVVAIASEFDQFWGAFPNPTAGPVRVVWSAAQATPVELRVYDASGRQVGATLFGLGTVGRNEWTIDLKQQVGVETAGIYYGRFVAGPVRETLRFLVLRNGR